MSFDEKDISFPIYVANTLRFTISLFLLKENIVFLEFLKKS